MDKLKETFMIFFTQLYQKHWFQTSFSVSTKSDMTRPSHIFSITACDKSKTKVRKKLSKQLPLPDSGMN